WAEGRRSSWNSKSSGSFNVAGNWNNGVPSDTDTAVFRRGTGTTYTVTFPGLISGLAIYQTDQLRIGSNNVDFEVTFHAIYQVLNPTTTESGRAVVIGETASDNAVLSTAIPLSAAAVTLGDAAGPSGTLNVNSSAFNLTG